MLVLLAGGGGLLRRPLRRFPRAVVQLSMRPAPAPSASSEPAGLNGTVRRILYRADSGYTVATLDCTAGAGGAAGAGARAVVITSPHCLALVQPGERLAVVGRWAQHQRYGAQLQVEATRELRVGPTPGSDDELLDLLSSKAIKGVGPKLAAARRRRRRRRAAAPTVPPVGRVGVPFIKVF